MTTRVDNPLGSGRTVVISPHFDDAIMSLGVTILRAARAGSEVCVLTVFGCSITSQEPAGEWDRKAGFTTISRSALARREEDRRACALVRAQPQWLEFGAAPYPRGAAPATIDAAVRALISPQDQVLLPGYPLVHADHLALALLLLASPLTCRRVGLYFEQPYVYYERSVRRAAARHEALAAPISPFVNTALEWVHVRASRHEQREKAKAVRAYRSQLPQLGLRFLGRWAMLRDESRRGGECFAWLEPR